jgi:hypothetical protein
MEKNQEAKKIYLEELKDFEIRCCELGKKAGEIYTCFGVG